MFPTVVFLEKLDASDPLPATHIHALTNLYNFNASKNAEIGCRWYELALTSPAAKDFAKDAANWIVDPHALKGRMKFCRPVFRVLFAVDPTLAKATFEANKTSFHPIARKLISKVNT